MEKVVLNSLPSLMFLEYKSKRINYREPYTDLISNNGVGTQATWEVDPGCGLTASKSKKYGEKV